MFARPKLDTRAFGSESSGTRSRNMNTPRWQLGFEAIDRIALFAELRELAHDLGPELCHGDFQSARDIANLAHSAPRPTRSSYRHDARPAPMQGGIKEA
jgi:hypothetical protein